MGVEIYRVRFAINRYKKFEWRIAPPFFVQIVKNNHF
jgi:hypothetical protein